MTNNQKLVYIDVESTGTNVSTDRIWQFSAICDNQSVDYYINPQTSVPPEVLELCSKPPDFNSFLATQPSFVDRADDILMWLQMGVLAGFGVINFDVPILWEELYRVKKIWLVQDLQIIDAKEIFHQKEPRDLAAAFKFYGGRQHTGAHDAMYDVIAARDVLTNMKIAYEDIRGMSLKELSAYCRREPNVDLAGKIIYNHEGVECYGFGDKKGTPVLDDLGMANWILRKDFPAQTKLVLRQILEKRDTKQKELL